MKPKVGMIGSGYAGLVTGACLAELGFSVLCMDLDKRKVDLINEGKTPIFENGLPELLVKLREANLIRATTSTQEVVEFSDIIFICTGTPSREDGTINLDQVESASKAIGESLRGIDKFKTIVVKSTVIPGTTANVVLPIIEKLSEKTAGKGFGIAMNPEFLKEGLAVEDFRKPDRVVIGAEDDRAYESVYRLYENFGCPILKVDTATAEMIKYAANTFLAVKISFINEISNMCEILGADITKVAEGMGLDQRISPHFLRPGLGFGGSCLPKDVRALASVAKFHGITAHTLEAALKINDTQPLRVIDLLEKELNLKDKTIAVLGLAFKPDTDDVRESRAMPIIHELKERGANVQVYDPVSIENAKPYLPESIMFAPSALEALKNADATLLVTEWQEFRDLKPSDFTVMKGKLIIDGRRVLDWKSLNSAGFEVRVLGNSR